MRSTDHFLVPSLGQQAPIAQWWTWNWGWVVGDTNGAMPKPLSCQLPYTQRATCGRGGAGEQVGMVDLSFPPPPFFSPPAGSLQLLDGQWETRGGWQWEPGPAASSQGRWPWSQARPRRISCVGPLVEYISLFLFEIFILPQCHRDIFYISYLFVCIVWHRYLILFSTQKLNFIYFFEMEICWILSFTHNQFSSFR